MQRPPLSPYRLLPEFHWADPWRILVCGMLRGRGPAARPVADRLFARWPTAAELTRLACVGDVGYVIAPLQLQSQRSRHLVSMSAACALEVPSDPARLPGVSSYVMEAWRLFVLLDPHFDPRDPGLVKYARWARMLARKEAKRPRAPILLAPSRPVARTLPPAPGSTAPAQLARSEASP